MRLNLKHISFIFATIIISSCINDDNNGIVVNPDSFRLTKISDSIQSLSFNGDSLKTIQNEEYYNDSLKVILNPAFDTLIFILGSIENGYKSLTLWDGGKFVIKNGSQGKKYLLGQISVLFEDEIAINDIKQNYSIGVNAIIPGGLVSGDYIIEIKATMAGLIFDDTTYYSSEFIIKRN